MTKEQINQVAMEVEKLLTPRFRLELEESTDGVFLQVLYLHTQNEYLERFPFGEECAGAFLFYDDREDIALQIDFEDWETADFKVEDLYTSVKSALKYMEYYDEV